MLFPSASFFLEAEGRSASQTLDKRDRSRTIEVRPCFHHLPSAQVAPIVRPLSKREFMQATVASGNESNWGKSLATPGTAEPHLKNAQFFPHFYCLLRKWPYIHIFVPEIFIFGFLHHFFFISLLGKLPFLGWHLRFRTYFSLFTWRYPRAS